MPQGDVYAPHGMTRIAPIDAEKTHSCCSKPSCCIRRHGQRANHKGCWPSTETHPKHAMPGCTAIIPQWDRRPQLTRGRLDAISAGSSCCAQRQRSGGPLRDTRRALCHVVRRLWQTRYRLVWDRSSSSTPSDPDATSNQMFSKISRGRSTGPGAVLPSLLPRRWLLWDG